MIRTGTERFVATVVVIAVVSVAIVANVALGFDEYSLRAAGFFALLGVLAQTLAYQLPRGVTGSISFIPFLSAVAVAPALPVVISIGLAVLLAEIMQGRVVLKTVFNVAQYMLSVAAAILVYRSLGGTPVGRDDALSVVPFIAAFASFFILNTVCVSGVIAISRHQRFLEVWWQNTHGALLYDVFAIPAVYGFAFVYVRFGAQWALGLAIPLFGLRQLYKTNWQLEQFNEELLQLMVAAIEARDPYTSGHSQRVSLYSQLVARAAGLSARSADRVSTAALLHDVGKIHEEFAPILRKPGRLTQSEYDVMKSHAEKGAALVGKVTQLRDLVPAIRGHHEAWNGSGYPDGLSAQQIPFWARIITLADTIDAMTTDRPYRAALDTDVVREEIRQQAGRQFDPGIALELTSQRQWELMSAAIREHRPGRRFTPLSNQAIPRVAADTIADVISAR